MTALVYPGIPVWVLLTAGLSCVVVAGGLAIWQRSRRGRRSRGRTR